MGKKYDLRDHKDEYITHLLQNIFWLPITAIIAVTTATVKVLFDKISSKVNYCGVVYFLIFYCISLSIISIILIIMIIIKNRKNKEGRWGNFLNDFSPNFKIDSLKAELCFKNRTDMCSTIEYKMKVLSEGESELKRNIIWSGNKYKGTVIKDCDSSYKIFDSKRNHSPYNYTINFGEKKKRDSDIEFTTVTSVSDDNMEMDPVYSYLVKNQIDKLTIRVVAPPNLIKKAKKSVYADRARDINILEPQNLIAERVGESEMYTFEILNPILLYNYFIEWEFT